MDKCKSLNLLYASEYNSFFKAEAELLVNGYLLPVHNHGIAFL